MTIDNESYQRDASCVGLERATCTCPEPDRTIHSFGNSSDHPHRPDPPLDIHKSMYRIDTIDIVSSSVHYRNVVVIDPWPDDDDDDDGMEDGGAGRPRSVPWPARRTRGIGVVRFRYHHHPSSRRWESTRIGPGRRPVASPRPMYPWPCDC